MLNHFRVECLQHISATTKSSATVEMHTISALLRVISFNVSVYRIIKTCKSQWEDFPLMINQWQLLKTANVWMMWYVENGVFLFKKLLSDEKACPQHNVKFIVF